MKDSGLLILNNNNNNIVEMIFVFVYFDEKLCVKIVFCVFKYLVSIKEKKKKKSKENYFWLIENF